MSIENRTRIESFFDLTFSVRGERHGFRLFSLIFSADHFFDLFSPFRRLNTLQTDFLIYYTFRVMWRFPLMVFSFLLRVRFRFGFVHTPLLHFSIRGHGT